MYHRQSSSIFTVNFEQVYFLYALVPHFNFGHIFRATEKRKINLPYQFLDTRTTK